MFSRKEVRFKWFFWRAFFVNIAFVIFLVHSWTLPKCLMKYLFKSILLCHLEYLCGFWPSWTEVFSQFLLLWGFLPWNTEMWVFKILIFQNAFWFLFLIICRYMRSHINWVKAYLDFKSLDANFIFFWQNCPEKKLNAPRGNFGHS